MKKEKSEGSLGEVAAVFFKLGCIAFGGPAAHIAMMEDEIVEKRKWLDKQRFLDLMGATNLIPGPNSTEMTMHCGHERAGVLGLFVAGACFIFPAVVLSIILAYLYVTYGELPAVQPFIFGIKPIVLALIGAAVFKLGKKAIKNWELAVLGALVLAASLFGINEIIALLVGGVLGAFYFTAKSSVGTSKKGLLPFLLIPSSTAIAGKITTASIWWTFLKVGCILYGSGYVLFAYLDAELVGSGWLTRPELMDAIAVGQFTPGPVLSTATFIGYQMGGVNGALAATAGIFLPSFIFVFLLNPLVEKMRRSKFLGYFLDSVNVAAVAVMLAVLLVMAYETIGDWRSLLIAAVGFVMTFYLKTNAIWTVLTGAVLGFLLLQFF